MRYAFMLVGMVCSIGASLQAGSIGLTYDFSAELALDTGNEKVEPFAKALYVLARYLIDPSMVVGVYDVLEQEDSQSDDLLLEDKNSKSLARKDLIVKGKTPVREGRRLSLLANRLLDRHDTKQIFKAAHRVGVSEEVVIAAAYDLAREWDDLDASSLFESVKQIRQNEKRSTNMVSFYSALLAGVVTLGAIYAWDPSLFSWS